MSKLSHLEKDSLLSDWQKEQRRRNFNNGQFFLPQQNIQDPWKEDKKTKTMMEAHIPALQGVEWGTRFRSNRDFNQNIKNKRILSAKNMFK